MLSFALVEQNGGFSVFEKTLPSLEELSGSKAVWIDFEKPSKGEIEFVQGIVKLHPLTVSDIFDNIKRPKAQVFSDYIFLIMHDVEFDGVRIVPTEVDFVVGKNFVLSFHSKSVNSIKKAMDFVVKDGHSFAKDSGRILHNIVNSIVDNYFPVLDKVSESVESVEAEVFSNATTKTLNKLFKLKKTLASFRRIEVPQREVVNFLYHHENGFIKKETTLYFRDIYDNLLIVSEFVDTSRELISDAFDAYLSVISNRLNEIMKVLTIISTIILPLTLIVGFYGMNVSFLEYDFFGERGAYFFAIFLMLVVAVIMAAWFKKRDWF
ncbi:MAG: magnesium/cobalt transporter CorA [archaeon]|nr:magnesium/cobalt transporter CorA [archaeon]